MLGADGETYAVVVGSRGDQPIRSRGFALAAEGVIFAGRRLIVWIGYALDLAKEPLVRGHAVHPVILGGHHMPQRD